MNGDVCGLRGRIGSEADAFSPVLVTKLLLPASASSEGVGNRDEMVDTADDEEEDEDADDEGDEGDDVGTGAIRWRAAKLIARQRLGDGR